MTYNYRLWRPNFNRLAIILCFLVLLCFSVEVNGVTNETSDALSSSATEEKPSNSGPRLRDPFWPIGFFPASMPAGAFDSHSRGRGETASQASNLSGMLRIGGVIRKGNEFYATINGFTVQTGEVVSVVADGEVYRFIVKWIDFTKVQFKPVK